MSGEGRMRTLTLWARSLRAYSFTATLIPAVCADLYARAIGAETNALLFALMLLCALLLHAAVNVLNDAYDYLLGFDTDQACGSSGLLLEGDVTPEWMLGWGRFYLGCAAVGGGILVAIRGWPLLVAGACGLAGAAFYSHPKGYKYKGLGEPLVFLLMGPLLFGSALVATAGVLPAGAFWPAMACGCWVSSILLVNNVRDMEMDRAGGFVTLPMRIGVERAVRLYGGLIGAAFVLVALPVVLGAAPLWRLLPLGLIPWAARRIRAVHEGVPPAGDLRCAPQQTAALYLLFGLLLATSFMTA